MSGSDRWHLRLSKDAAVSFQRFAWPPAGIVRSTPSSLGALPVAASSDATAALLPVAAGEAFWIGLDPLGARGDAALALRVRLSSGRAVDALSGRAWREGDATIVQLPGTRRIEGIARPDGAFDVFGCAPANGAASCAALAFLVTGPAGHARVEVEVVDYAAFAARSGDEPPAPLDHAAGYRGHRLP